MNRTTMTLTLVVILVTACGRSGLDDLDPSGAGQVSRGNQADRPIESDSRNASNGGAASSAPEVSAPLATDGEADAGPTDGALPDGCSPLQYEIVSDECCNSAHQNFVECSSEPAVADWEPGRVWRTQACFDASLGAPNIDLSIWSVVLAGRDVMGRFVNPIVLDCGDYISIKTQLVLACDEITDAEGEGREDPGYQMIKIPATEKRVEVDLVFLVEGSSAAEYEKCEDSAIECCEQSLLPTEYQLCDSTDGRWNVNYSCFRCGVALPGDQCVGTGCDCGLGRTFVEAVGCQEDGACPVSGCGYRGTAYEVGEILIAGEGACCLECVCTDTGEVLCLDECVPCDGPPPIVPVDRQLCESTEGQWDGTSCGHYYCGQEPDADCVDPGCNCGVGRNFVEGVGCQNDSTCTSACGWNGLRCNSATEVCLEELRTLCIPVPLGCERDRTCGCPGICGEGFVGCTAERGINWVVCNCPSC